jgi:deazaflavin-dependent oxidoreductase (nitroreductase family)
MSALFRLFVAAHVGIFRATGGRIGGKIGRTRTMLLTTTGNKSGAPRTVPLMCFDDEAGLVVIASAAGSPTHPAWFKNLQKKPEATVETTGKQFAARAEIATGDDRARIWKKVVEQEPRFAGYEKKAVGREIPVVVLKATA